MRKQFVRGMVCAAVLTLMGCGDGGTGAAGVPGVDLERQILRIGALNDESGPVAAIGRPYALGKRLLAAEINAGDSGLLPDGWTVELVERDHGYNPQRSVQTFNEIRNDVLFLGTSFGTPNTLPLLPMLKRHELVAFPASSASKLLETTLTPILAPSYKIEGARALEVAIEMAGGADAVKAAVVYQHDDYGQDGYDGWVAAAAHHGVEVVARQTYTPGQADFTATITALRRAGATHVLLASVPSATAPILGTAAQLNYQPVFLGISAAWIDRFFDPSVVPPSVFDRYVHVTGQRFIGEDFPAMQRFQAARTRFDIGGDLGNDSYAFGSYVQGLVGVEAFRRALAANDVSRAGFRRALATLTDYTAEGTFAEPLDFSTEPYSTGGMTRALKLDPAARSWTVISDFAAPDFMP